MTNQDEIATVVARFYAALRANDVKAWVALFAPDAIAADPVGTPPHHGHDALSAFLTGVLQLFQSFGLAENSVYCVPGGAAVKWTGVGRGKNGRDVTFEGIDVFEVDTLGRIKTLSAYWNAEPVMEAISAAG